jgi:predicted phage terminase large subunit-like protein
MDNKIASLLHDDFLAFARKAIRELDGTRISKDRYLDLLATELMKVAGGTTRRLIINMPPRHLKTQLASVCLSAWILAHDPKKKIMIVTYSEDLARQIARSIRSILQADWFKKLFHTRIARGHAAAMKFATTAGGEVFAASIDGSVTGFGADMIIVDDPHNVKDAGNLEQLENTIGLFETVVMPRLNNPNKGCVIVIAQRIHDEDLSAYLLADGGWTHILLPLIATRDQTFKTAYGTWVRHEGTLLRPDDYDMDDVERRRTRSVNPAFDLLYQQDVDGQALPPIAAGHFQLYKPDNLSAVPYVISIDTGTDQGDGRSFSVIQIWASVGNKHYLVHQYRARCDFHDLCRMAKQLCRRYPRCPVLVERTANGPALITKLKRIWPKRVYEITPRGSKASRLRPHIEAIIAGRIHLPLDAPFSSRFVQEFAEFPHGHHTDQVDAFTQYMDWFLNHSDQLQPTGSASGIAACGLNSHPNSFDRRHQPKPQDRGIMAVSGNNNRMPNAPFPTVKAWVKF